MYHRVASYCIAALGGVAALVGAVGVAAGGGTPSNFSFTGSLATGRYAHTATLLPNGDVLVAGGAGFSDSPPLVSAELYHLDTKTWSGTGNLATARVFPATLLPNGKVLVTGRYNSNGSAVAAELYDPETGIWSATGTPNIGRNKQTATLLANGKVLIVGGIGLAGSALSSAEIYDPATAKWTTTGSLSDARLGHTATLLQNGKVLVAGGASSVAELYDPAMGKWFTTDTLATARESHTATLLPSGKVLIAGGNAPGNQLAVTAELYDPVTDTWSPTGSLAEGRYQHTATLLPSGLVLVAGGFGSGSVLVATELYDPSTGSWTAASDLLKVRYFHTATLLPSGPVLVAGGFPGFSSAEIYDPASTSIPAPLQNISTRANVLAGDNVLIGGFIITGNIAKKIMLRAIGPSMTDLGVTGALADPTLELHKLDGVVINDNWKIDDATGQSQEAAIRATTIPPLNDLESALVQTLAPGSYTVIVRGKNGTGIGLVEVYDLDQAGAPSQLANISSRGFVDTGNNVMIGGFILGPGSSGNNEVIVRAIGPSLRIRGALADPTLALHNAHGDKVASNDNWKLNDSTGQSQEADIRPTTIPPSYDLESALVVILPPGNYTAIVAGKGGGTGIALVEVYKLH